MGLGESGITKGRRGDEEHEVGLDRTMGTQVTFELLSAGGPDYLWEQI